jgi:hypothetical protein
LLRFKKQPSADTESAPSAKGDPQHRWVWLQEEGSEVSMEAVLGQMVIYLYEVGLQDGLGPMEVSVGKRMTQADFSVVESNDTTRTELAY